MKNKKKNSPTVADFSATAFNYGKSSDEEDFSVSSVIQEPSQ